MEQAILVGVIVSATLPFVIAIMSAFSRATRVDGIEGYFVFDKQLDTDGFIKTTIGYSLQVAAIVLLFYWTIAFGIAAPLIVCAAWGGGYYLLARAVRNGNLDKLLGVGSAEGSEGRETIHGYIGAHVRSGHRTRRDLAVASVALASVIGLGGAMMTEVDYTTNFFVSALRLNISDSTAWIGIIATFVIFTVLYVLWGGYKSAVFTDRFQVPLAYVAFSVFGFGLTVLAGARSSSSGIGWIMLFMVALLVGLLFRRLRTISALKNDVSSLRIFTLFTFLPAILVGSFALFAISSYASASPWSGSALWAVAFPPVETVFGLGLWGLVALVFANGIWQFVDISSLQRLQSITRTDDIAEDPEKPGGQQQDAHQDDLDRLRIARTLQWAGMEAGLGWALIVLTGLIIRSSRFVDDNFIQGLLSSPDWRAGALVCIFIFTAIVYMLSTISGFISAISYIAYYDILPMLGTNIHNEQSSPHRLTVARLTSVLAIGSIFFLYAMLRVVRTDIAAILYAIYAFQIVILPSALVAIFAPGSRRIPLYAGAVVPSVVVGMLAAWFAAVTADGWTWFSAIGVGDSSWAVFPPLFSAAAATLTFVFATIILRTSEARRQKT